ncbi:hypothetical protein ABWJ92_37540 [Streptomyces sp. NPDC000609]
MRRDNALERHRPEQYSASRRRSPPSKRAALEKLAKNCADTVVKCEVAT